MTGFVPDLTPPAASGPETLRAPTADSAPDGCVRPPQIDLQGGSGRLQGGLAEGRDRQEPDFSPFQDGRLAKCVQDFALAQVGKGYDYAGIAGFLARKDLQTADRWFCSELVSAAFWSAGIPLLRREPHKVAPGDLRDSPLLQMEAMLFTPAARGRMDAAECRRLPGRGLRVALYSGRSLVSRGIRLRTWSEYSHAAIVLPDNSVVESLPGQGVVHHPDITQFHKPQTCIEIHQPLWWAIIAVLAAKQEQMGTEDAQ